MGNKASRKYITCPDKRREANENEWQRRMDDAAIDVKAWLEKN